MTALPTPGTLVDDKYEIESLLGRGGMAAVFRAKHRLSHRTVAIKWLLPHIARDASVVERFLREARAASALDHPAVVAVLDVGRWNDGYYLVMEHLVGETLRQRLERGPLSVAEALSILTPLLGAVASAHAKGIVHRDIKPENVFLRRHDDGRVSPKLLDFGISKLTAEESLTLTGAVIGTPDYLAPEQITATKDVGPRTDVYQLGVLLYEMLAGRTPFARPTYEALLAAILTTEPTPLAALRPDLPPGLLRVVAHAMAHDPAARPDVAGLAAELAHVFDPRADAHAQTVAATPPTRIAAPLDTPAPAAKSATAPGSMEVSLPPAPPVRSLAPVLVGVVIVGALVAGALAWMARSGPSTDAPPVPDDAALAAPDATTATADADAGPEIVGPDAAATEPIPPGITPPELDAGRRLPRGVRRPPEPTPDAGRTRGPRAGHLTPGEF